MKFVADECCDAGLISLLRSEGHDTIYIKESRPGALDKEVLEKAFAEERILLTEVLGYQPCPSLIQDSQAKR